MVFNRSGHNDQICFRCNPAAVLRITGNIFSFELAADFCRSRIFKITVAAGHSFSGSAQVLCQGTHAGAGDTDEEDAVKIVDIVDHQRNLHEFIFDQAPEPLRVLIRFFPVSVVVKVA